MLQVKKGLVKIRVEIKLESGLNEPYAEIHAVDITQEIKNVAELLQRAGSLITATDSRERIVAFEAKDIYMVRIEDGRTVIHMEKDHYYSRKRLCELLPMLGAHFTQISKAAAVNLLKLECAEPGFNGMMRIRLKNGDSEYISRKYLPLFKKHLGL